MKSKFFAILHQTLACGWLLCGLVPALGQDAPPSPTAGITREIKFFDGPKKWIFYMSISNQDFSVDFIKSHCWNISSVQFKGRTINIPSGCTGTVLQWKDGTNNFQWAGTGHGKETVQDAYLMVDGKKVDVNVNGKDVYDKTQTLTGHKASFIRKGLIFSFQNEEQFDFPADGNFFIATHRYKLLSTVTTNQWQGGAYTYMQMMPRKLNHWLAVLPDGLVREGKIEENPPAGTRQSTIEFGKVKAMACYSPEWKIGIVYAFPVESPGRCHLNDRPGKDIKFRSGFPPELGDKTEFKDGETFEFKMKVIPFEATPEEWKKKAGELSRESGF